MGIEAFSCTDLKRALIILALRGSHSSRDAVACLDRSKPTPCLCMPSSLPESSSVFPPSILLLSFTRRCVSLTLFHFCCMVPCSDLPCCDSHLRFRRRNTYYFLCVPVMAMWLSPGYAVCQLLVLRRKLGNQDSWTNSALSALSQ